MATFVLVHGGAHGAWCWAPLFPHLEAPALALDLPGRGARPADLATVTCESAAASAVSDIERANLRDVILVGHSMGGLTLPRVAARIPERLAHLVFVSCVVPPPGRNVLDVISGEAKQLAETGSGARTAAGMSEAMVRHMFCNDMDEEQTSFVLRNLSAEASAPIAEPMDSAGLAQPIPRTYVKLMRDQSLQPEVQDAVIATLEPVEIRVLDAGHDVMISRPRALAEVLNGLL